MLDEGKDPASLLLHLLGLHERAGEGGSEDVLVDEEVEEGDGEERREGGVDDDAPDEAEDLKNLISF